MPRKKEYHTRAELVHRLGERGQTLRQAAEAMGLNFDQAAYYRKRVRARQLLSLSGYGAYDITGKGKEFVARWGPRETSQSASSETSQ
ncbi:MAG: hypothetical protein V3U45_05995, partial [bacterium]